MLDVLAALARKRWVLVTAAVLVVLAVVGPALVDDSDDGTAGAPTATSASGTATATTAPGGTGEVASTGPADVPEVDREGSGPDTSLYGAERVAGSAPGAERRAHDQDRAVGGDEPARISGYSAWVDAADAPEVAPDDAPGPWVRVRVRVLNRDEGPQPYTFEDWTLADTDGVVLQAFQASRDFRDGASLPAHAQVEGELWFQPRSEGRHWLLYRPQNDQQRGVWAVDVPAT